MSTFYIFMIGRYGFFYHTQYPYPKKNNKRRQQQEAHTKFKPWVKKCYGTENNVNYPQRL